MIDFNRPCQLGTEAANVMTAIESGKLSGGGPFAQKCEQWLRQKLDAQACLLTPSCTAALEMCALLLDIKPGDEVIMPSYTFVSTASAFVLFGAKIKFVDIRPDTLNVDENQLACALTDNTKAIVVVHYAGVGCNMPAISTFARKHDIALIEDAAQAIDCSIDGRPLGSFGQLATFSFHETKNITSGGEGGALVINDRNLVARAEILREKGTNRKAFFRGEIDKYSWVDIGSSYLPSELQAAFLYAQLQRAEQISSRRLKIWQRYNQAFLPLADKGVVILPQPPKHYHHNAHIFYLLVKRSFRNKLLQQLRENNVQATFHYVPLHTSEPGLQYGEFCGNDCYTTDLSERIVRLPLWYGLSDKAVAQVIEVVTALLEETE